MLADPSIVEREVLGAIRYQPNRATLHTDIDLLSPRRRAWAAWNYDRRHAAVSGSTVTYDMTTLQHLEGEHRYLVSLNSDEWIDPRRVIRSFDYAHPVYDLAAVDAQSRFDEIDGVGGVHYCGAWWGHGFHEDGMVSGAPSLCTCGAICARPIGRRQVTVSRFPRTRWRLARRSRRFGRGSRRSARERCSTGDSRRSCTTSAIRCRTCGSIPIGPSNSRRIHPLWSHRHPAPARFRASDYGDGTTVGLGDQVRDAVGDVLGRRPDGPIRMLTQVRRWGWLFNPITVYVAWNLGTDGPVALVLEVTNTPWKERHRYAAAAVQGRNCSRLRRCCTSHRFSTSATTTSFGSAATAASISSDDRCRAAGRVTIPVLTTALSLDRTTGDAACARASPLASDAADPPRLVRHPSPGREALAASACQVVPHPGRRGNQR